jgi:hypothetical protein
VRAVLKNSENDFLIQNGKSMKSRILVAFVVLLTSLEAYAQFPEDALRLGQAGFGVSARSMSMGNAMTGLSEGYDATYFNPAGLAQSRQSEVTAGLNFLGYNDDATYLSNSSSLSSSQTDLSSLGIVYPFPTTKGSFVIALGYNRGTDYNSALSISTGGVANPNSSIIPSLYSPYDTSADIPYMLYLEDVNGNPLVKGNVQQSGKVYKSGGLNNWHFSLGTDIAYNFAVGLTLNLVSGSYHYDRTFVETGVPSGGNYNGSDFSSFVLNDKDDQDISGWNAKVGFLYRMDDGSGNTSARFGATITFPTFATITDNYSAVGTAYYTTPPSPLSYSTTNGYGESESGYPGPSLNYDVTTPFKFAIGASGNLSALLVAVDVEYVDWTQLKFGNSTNLPSSTIDNLNSSIRDEFRATTDVRAGLELPLANPDFSMFIPYLRVGGEYLMSPYVGDGSDQAQKFVSGGIGVRIQNSINIDLGYQYGWWNTTSQIYPSTSINNVTYSSQSTSNEKITNTNFMFTFSYNF